MFSHFFSKPKNKPLKISAYSIWKCWKYFMNVDLRSVRLKQPYAQSHTFVGEWKKGENTCIWDLILKKYVICWN